MLNAQDNPNATQADDSGGTTPPAPVPPPPPPAPILTPKSPQARKEVP